MKKRDVIGLSLIVFLLLIIAPSASASISVEITPIKDIILPDENATFEIRVTNNGKMEDTFRISTGDIGWSIESSPGVLKIAGASSDKALITITPLGKKKSASYSMVLLIYSPETGVINKQELTVKCLEYKDLISTKLEIPPGGLDVKKVDSLKLTITSKHKVLLESLNVKLISDIFTLEKIENLDAQQIKEVKFLVPLKETTPEGLYDTNILITKGEIVYVNKTEKVNVGPYSNVKQTKATDDKFLLSKTIVSKTNIGNSNVYETYSLELGSIEKRFTKFEPKPTTKKENIYEWEFTLKPGQTYTIVSTKNYRSPIISLIALAIIICLLYYWFKNPVSIRKKVLTVKNEEGLSEMKVLLIIKNNSPQEIKDIKIMDMLPRIMKEPTEFGTIKPRMVKKGDNNMLLFWEISSLIKGEERILSYKIKSKIKVIGRLVVPRAICSYRGKITQKRSTVSSNKTVLFS